MGRLIWIDGPTKSFRALTPPTRVALVCSYSHHLTQDTIPWNLDDLKPAWDPPSRSLKLPWTGKSRVHFTEPLRWTCPFTILFPRWCWSAVGRRRAGPLAAGFKPLPVQSQRSLAHGPGDMTMVPYNFDALTLPSHSQARDSHRFKTFV